MPLKGARETAANLRELARFVTVPLNAASRFALAPTLSAAKRNARALPLKETTGSLAASLVIRREPKSPKVNPVHRVGPNADYERQTALGPRRPIKYAHLVEFGTAPHYQPGRGVMHPGTPPRPFLAPAFFSTRDDVVKRFGGRIGPEMEKRAAKLGRKIR
jgi:hypothetical protein